MCDAPANHAATMVPENAELLAKQVCPDCSKITLDERPSGIGDKAAEPCRMSLVQMPVWIHVHTSAHGGTSWVW